LCETTLRRSRWPGPLKEGKRRARISGLTWKGVWKKKVRNYTTGTWVFPKVSRNEGGGAPSHDKAERLTGRMKGLVSKRKVKNGLERVK